MAATTTAPVGLFGGAMRALVPKDYSDVSKFRQVPDNQEVFANADGSTSVILELLERQDDVLDAEAVNFFFNDLAKLNHAVQAHVDANVVLEAKHYAGVASDAEAAPAVAFGLTGTQVAIKGRPRPGAPVHRVRVCMALLRLGAVSTDILVTLNTVLPDDDVTTAAAARLSALRSRDDAGSLDADAIVAIAKGTTTAAASPSAAAAAGTAVAAADADVAMAGGAGASTSPASGGSGTGSSAAPALATSAPPSEWAALQWPAWFADLVASVCVKDYGLFGGGGDDA